MAKKQTKTLSPQQAKSFDKICKLNKSEFWAGEFALTLYHDGDIRVGVNHACIIINRKDFDRLIRWYQQPQKLKSNDSKSKKGHK